MIYVESKGGIGNQLYLANMAFRLQNEFSQEVKLDSSWHKRKNNREFALPDCIVSESAISIGNYWLQRQLAKDVLETDLTEFEIKSFLKQICNSPLPRSYLLKGYFQFDSLISQDFLSLIRFCIEKVVLKEEVVRSLHGRTLIHIRLGDFLVNPSFAPARPQYFAKALNKYDNLNGVIMTDSLEFHHLFPSLREIPILDTSKLSPFEILCLSKHVKAFIGSNSSLSRWIGYLVREYGGMHSLPVSKIGCKCCIPRALVMNYDPSIDIHTPN